MAMTRKAGRVGTFGTTLGRPNFPNLVGDFGPFALIGLNTENP